VRFTHSDPFEDTESQSAPVPADWFSCFTHSDPFEDTESGSSASDLRQWIGVSPTPIRLRILKVHGPRQRLTRLAFHPLRSV